MAKQSQTELAVLAALSVEPMTGYALRDAVSTHLGAFWSESFGQIYPALARLRAAGLVEAVATGPTGKALHRLTADGRVRLVELLREPPTVVPPRNGTLLRLFFGDVIGPEACRDLVVAARQRAESTLAELAVARREAESEAGQTPHQPYWLMTVSAGEHTARATISWADETLAALDADV